MNGLVVEQIAAGAGMGVLDWLQDLQREVFALREEVADLRRENSELRRENAKVRRENTELRRENLELRQQVGYWKSMHAAAAARVVKLEAEVAELRGENRQLQARLFGQLIGNCSGDFSRDFNQSPQSAVDCFGILKHLRNIGGQQYQVCAFGETLVVLATHSA
jgi:regulator of replication initiation timing